MHCEQCNLVVLEPLLHYCCFNDRENITAECSSPDFAANLDAKTCFDQSDNVDLHY